MSALGRSNVIHNPGYLEDGTRASYKMAVLAVEAIAMVKRIVSGFGVNEETLATHVVHQGGPGGELRTSEDNLKHFRQEHWRPHLFDRAPFDTWVANWPGPPETVSDSACGRSSAHTSPRL